MMIIQQLRSLVYLCFLLVLSDFSIASGNEPTSHSIQNVLEMKIESSINPATLNYLREGMKKAQQSNSDLVLIKLNTPGGLVSTTKDILTLFGSSAIPIAIWVSPEGASATSAGAIIGSSAHFLFLDNGTNIGAATPVQMDKEMGKDLRAKAINDLTALVESLAQARGRNSAPFKKMITKAESYSAKEALKLQLIDGIAANVNELFSQLNGKTIKVKGKAYKTLVDSSPTVKVYEMDPGQKLLNIFSNPNLVYILFLLGAALLYFEVQAPGGFIAGSIGAICLILAGIGFQVLPLNWGSFGLIILAFILFIIEIYVTSYGLLSLAGMASLLFGSLFLFRTEDSYLEINKTLIFSSVGGIGIFLLLIAYMFIKDMKKGNKVDFFTVEGKTGSIQELLDPHQDEFYYQVKVEGRIWRAKSKEQFALNEDCKVITQDNNKLILTIVKL